jgi:hypothetical protein
MIKRIWCYVASVLFVWEDTVYLLQPYYLYHLGGDALPYIRSACAFALGFYLSKMSLSFPSPGPAGGWPLE